MQREDLRTVEIKKSNGEIIQGYFHQWVISKHKKDKVIKTYVVAITELEDGNIMTVAAGRIRFINPGVREELK